MIETGWDLTDALLAAQDWFEALGIDDCEHELRLSPEMLAVVGDDLMVLGGMSQFNRHPFRIVEQPPTLPSATGELRTTVDDVTYRTVFYDLTWAHDFLALHYPPSRRRTR